MKAGLDFGTSNSTIGTNKEGKVEITKFGNGSNSQPSALFFNEERNQYSYGENAYNKYTKGEKGRLMLSLKRGLGQNLSTQIGSTKESMVDLIGRYIGFIKEEAEKNLEQKINSVVIGRPVKFHDNNQKKDADAQNELAMAARKAGFKNIEFLYEPIGGIYGSLDKIQNSNLMKKEGIFLICDIGGGTADFSLAKIEQKGGIEIISNNGIYLGGDEFTADLIWKEVVPSLGKGSKYKELDKIMTVPNKYFTELKYWNSIKNIGDWKSKRQIEKYLTFILAKDKEKFGRLLEIAKTPNTGYLMHAMAEKHKKELTYLLSVEQKYDMFEIPFSKTITRNRFNEIISRTIEKILESLNETLTSGGIKKQSIDGVILTGGTTKIPIIEKKIIQDIGQDKIINTNRFTTVGKGLTKYAGEIFQ